MKPKVSLPYFVILTTAFSIYSYFFWSLPETTPSLVLLRFLGQHLVFLAIGLEGLVQAERDIKDKGYTFNRYTPWLMIAVFVIGLAYQCWELFS